MKLPDVSKRLATLALLVLMSAFVSSDALAQGFSWPESPENLKVLPDSIRGEALGQVMKGFAFALGVRCSHCHVGEGGDLTQYDFPADDKETKRIARVMLEMVEHVNGLHLSPVDTIRESASSRVEVTCVTCHRGVSKPRMIQDIMSTAVAENGLDVADSTYRALREEYYGGFSYNFKPGPLASVAEDLAGQGQVDDALALLELEAEFNPESYMTYFGMANIRARAGRTAEAVASMEKAVEFAPEQFKGFFRQQLERLQQGGDEG